MARTTFNIPQRVSDTELVNNEITFGAVDADWRVSGLTASATSARAHLYVLIEGNLAFTVSIPADSRPFTVQFGTGDSLSGESAGIVVGRGKTAVVIMAPEADTPPPGWVFDLNVTGTVNNFADVAAVVSSVSFSSVSSPAPGQPPTRGVIVG